MLWLCRIFMSRWSNNPWLTRCVPFRRPQWTRGLGLIVRVQFRACTIGERSRVVPLWLRPLWSLSISPRGLTARFHPHGWPVAILWRGAEPAQVVVPYQAGLEAHVEWFEIWNWTGDYAQVLHKLRAKCRLPHVIGQVWGCVHSSAVHKLTNYGYDHSVHLGQLVVAR